MATNACATCISRMCIYWGMNEWILSCCCWTVRIGYCVVGHCQCIHSCFDLPICIRESGSRVSGLWVIWEPMSTVLHVIHLRAYHSGQSGHVIHSLSISGWTSDWVNLLQDQASKVIATEQQFSNTCCPVHHAFESKAVCFGTLWAGRAQSVERMRRIQDGSRATLRDSYPVLLLRFVLTCAWFESTLVRCRSVNQFVQPVCVYSGNLMSTDLVSFRFRLRIVCRHFSYTKVDGGCEESSSGQSIHRQERHLCLDFFWKWWTFIRDAALYTLDTHICRHSTCLSALYFAKKTHLGHLQGDWGQVTEQRLRRQCPSQPHQSTMVLALKHCFMIMWGFTPDCTQYTARPLNFSSKTLTQSCFEI